MKIWEIEQDERLQADHRAQGGKFLRRYVVEVHDGMIRVMAGLEPAGENGRMIWHLSFSHFRAEGGQIIDKPRKPTKKEVEKIKRELLAEVPMKIEKPGDDPKVVQMWQIEE